MAGEWLTPAEILELGVASLPTSISKLQELIARENWRGDETRCRVRFGRGGGYEYHVSLLPSDARARVFAAAAPLATQAEARSQAEWAWFERLSEKAKETARQRLVAVEAVQSFGNSTRRELAVDFVAREFKVSRSTLWSWMALVEGVRRDDRLPALAPRHVGRTVTAPCDPRAWDFLTADYLRAESPRFESCYNRLTRAIAQQGWSPVPSAKTLKRRLEKEFPRAVRVLAREGREAAARIYPHQRRTRSHFHAMQAVNADGHKFDVFVKFEDGTITRPMMVGFQDLYSGAIVGFRIDRTESKELVRLALADMVERYGIPEKVWFDNGRAFASKWMTGRMPTRFRFKVKDEEPQGILLSLGISGNDIHWTTPYHGQAKPIERAWRDFADHIEKHPDFAGAYTGNNPMAKPENYGSKAIPIEKFRSIVTAEIAAHNARPGRRSAVAKGRSFDEVLRESLAASGTLVRRATAAQRRMLLMAAEGLTVRGPTAEIILMETRYWAEELVEHMDRKVVVRFDPQNLAEPLGVYTMDGRFICEAQPIGDVRFDDVDAAKAHARRRKDYLGKQRAFLDADRRMNVDEVAALLPAPEPMPVESPKVQRLVVGGRANADWGGAGDFGRGIELMGEGLVVPFARPTASEDD